MALTGGIRWGFSGCYGQYLLEQKGIEAPWLVAVRLFFAGIILTPIGFKPHGRDNLRVLRKEGDTIRSLIFAISGITFYQFIYSTTTQTSNVGTTAVLQYLLLILISTVVCMRELYLSKGLELATVGLSLFGTFVIGIHGDTRSFHITGEALFWGLLAVVGSTIYAIIPGGLTFRYDMYQVLGLGMLLGGIAVGAVVQPWNYEVTWDAGIAGVLVDAMMVGIAIVFSLYLQGVSMIGSLKGSIMGSVEPISVVVMSVFWLRTRSTLSDFLGFALILGVVFVSIFAHRPGGEMARGVDFSADS